MCSLLGKRWLGWVAVFHQFTYLPAPISLMIGGAALPAEFVGQTPSLPTELWAPVFAAAHALIICCLIFRMPFTGLIASLGPLIGFLAISGSAPPTDVGQFVRTWNMSPNAAQALALSVALFWDAVVKRERV